MPKPSEWHMKHYKVTKPKDDSEYFERMSKVIFMAGLNWQVLDKKWPGIQKAFAGFDIAKVAKFQEPEIEELMNNTDVIRNLAKIRAIIKNAQEIQKLAEEEGSFESYLARLHKEGGEDGMRDAVSKRFAFLGKGTTVIFLFSVGQDLPKAAAEWQAHHQK